TPHNESSAVLAEEFLTEVAYPEEKKAQVVDAILKHGTKGMAKYGDDLSKLAEVIREGDKVSRGCYGCKAEETCDWNPQKKNLEVLW
ncbi:MAG: hypothetical protein MJ097_05300, partial [Dorea sp.]|nr:hypothetical protein [Dorea sp.]